MDIAGGCHCGNITFTLEWPADTARIPARRCDCTFCVKHGGVWTSHPRARLLARVSRSGHLGRYRFGTKTADFIVCTRCGVAPLVTSAIDGADYAVVNVNTFENVDRSVLDFAPASFDGEEVGSRLDRRRRHWIGEVRILEIP